MAHVEDFEKSEFKGTEIWVSRLLRQKLIKTEKDIGIKSSRGGGGRPPKQKKVVEKCYFPEVYKMTRVLEDRRENG